jgi:hypothetical protein
MTEPLVVAVALMGGLLLMLVVVRTLVRNTGGLLVALCLSVLLIIVAAGAGVTVWHRVTSSVQSSIEQGLHELQATPPPKPTPPRTAATATAIPGPPPALLAAERQVAEMGYQVSDPSTFHPEYPLHVLIGVAGDAAAVPHHEWAFFFTGDGRLLGQDAFLPSAGLLVIGQNPAMVALGYQLYAPDDDACCPTLGKAVVRFRLDRGRLRPLDVLPGNAARRACCPVGATPPAEPVPPGSRLM